jgi:hypothetical protein
MNAADHKKRHKELHSALDELFADYITQHPTQRNFTQMPIIQLIEWASKQKSKPDHPACKITRKKGVESL